MPCVLASSSAFQMERQKVCIILLLDRKLVCSIVASWPPQEWLWNNFCVSAKSYLPLSTLILIEWHSMPSSSDQWFPNGESVMHSTSFKKNTEILRHFWRHFVRGKINQLFKSNFYDPFKCAEVIPGISYHGF